MHPKQNWISTLEVSLAEMKANIHSTLPSKNMNSGQKLCVFCINEKEGTEIFLTKK